MNNDGLRIEIHRLVLRPYRIAVEMAAAMLARKFGPLEFSHMQGSTDAPTLASIRVVEKLGMRRFRQAIVGGLDTVYFGKHKSGFDPTFQSSRMYAEQRRTASPGRIMQRRRSDGRGGERAVRDFELPRTACLT